MKRLTYILMAIIMSALLCACASNPRCEYDEAIAELKAAEDMYTYVYADEKGYSIDGVEIAEMLSGEWTKTSRPKDMEKIVSFAVGTQHEICIFEGDAAIIYCGYAGVFQSDRQYYSCKISADVEDICEYVRANGEEVVVEE